VTGERVLAGKKEFRRPLRYWALSSSYLKGGKEYLTRERGEILWETVSQKNRRVAPKEPSLRTIEREREPLGRGGDGMPHAAKD